MEVIYTPDIFSVQQHGGVSRYFVEMIRRLPADRVRPLIAAGLHRNEYLRKVPGGLGWYLPKMFKRHALNARWYEAVCCFHPRALVHETFYAPRQTAPDRRAVLTVYDMINETWDLAGPDPAPFVSRSAVKRAACARATHLIAISQATKNDMVRIFGLDPAKITVVHLAGSFAPDDPGRSQPRLSAGGKPFLLHVGPRGSYKNFPVLLEAYAGSPALRGTFDLVCFGGPEFDPQERRRLDQLGVAGSVRRRAGDDRALRAAYLAAAAYVCPSLHEGFGIPVLEAMNLGCPVFCARNAALEEVAGEGARYFDPLSSDDLRQTLEETLPRQDELSALSERGSSQAKRFSWERCAAETLAVYQRVASAA